MKNNRKEFSVTDPIRFLEMVKEKEEPVESLVPELRALFTQTKETQETTQPVPDCASCHVHQR